MKYGYGITDEDKLFDELFPAMDSDQERLDAYVDYCLTKNGESKATADGYSWPNMPPSLLPTAVFLVAAAVSFATGTSWGTMAILTPLAVPLALVSATDDSGILAATVAAILGGSVFGDHCSPISDTTILSSMASGCDHVDHVRTQLPYALFSAAIAVFVGYLPFAVIGVPPWVLLLIGIAIIAAWVRIVGRPISQV